MIIFIEEDDSGNVNISTLFTAHHYKTEYIQHQVTENYLSIKDSLAADHLDYFSYCEYDFFHKLFYPQSQYQSSWNFLSAKKYHIKIY